jgi:hypothetical protein
MKGTLAVSPGNRMVVKGPGLSFDWTVYEHVEKSIASG